MKSRHRRPGWWRKLWHRNGDAAGAIRDAQEQHKRAKGQATTADQVTKRARQAINRTDAFVSEVTRSWHLRGS